MSSFFRLFFRTFFITAVIALLTCSTPGFGGDTTVVVTEKQSRWSLSEWLEQRDKMRLMDLWLALHSPSPYEFFIGADYQSGHFSDLSYYGGWDFFAAAYASIFGVELDSDYTNLSQRTNFIFDFRFFGLHAQSTNLTLQGGAKYESRSYVAYWNPLLGLSMTFYVSRYFGFEALYRHYFSSSSHGIATTGDRFEGGAFLDFKFLRLFGDIFQEQETGADALSRIGGKVGTKLFF